MDIKFLSFLCFLMVAFSCKKTQDVSAISDDKTIDSLAINAKDVSKIRYTDYILDTKTENVIIFWDAYKELQGVIDGVKNADFSFFYNNKKGVNELLVNLKQNIPLEVNNPSILSRISALETKILKFESLINLTTTSKTELLANIQDVLVAFSNLNLQMNKKIELDNIIIERPGGENLVNEHGLLNEL